MIRQNRVRTRRSAGFPLPAALLLLVGTSVVTAGEMCLEAELQQVVESALAAPRPQSAPEIGAAPAERDLMADTTAPVDPPVQRATGIRVIEGTLLREDLGAPR